MFGKFVYKLCKVKLLGIFMFLSQSNPPLPENGSWSDVADERRAALAQFVSHDDDQDNFRAVWVCSNDVQETVLEFFGC
jgi:hypothetical protein